MEKLKQNLFSLLELVVVRRGVPTAANSGAVIVCAQFILSLAVCLSCFLLGWILPLKSSIVLAILDCGATIALLHFFGGLRYVTGSASLLKSLAAPDSGNSATGEFALIVQSAAPLLALCLYPIELVILFLTHTDYWLLSAIVLAAAAAVELLRPRAASRGHWIAAGIVTFFYGLLFSKLTGCGNGLLIAMLGFAAAIICANLFKNSAKLHFTWCTAYLLMHSILILVFILANAF